MSGTRCEWHEDGLRLRVQVRPDAAPDRCRLRRRRKTASETTRCERHNDGLWYAGAGAGTTAQPHRSDGRAVLLPCAQSAGRACAATCGDVFECSAHVVQHEHGSGDGRGSCKYSSVCTSSRIMSDDRAPRPSPSPKGRGRRPFAPRRRGENHKRSVQKRYTCTCASIVILAPSEMACVGVGST